MKLYRIIGPGGHITFRYVDQNRKCKNLKCALLCTKYTFKIIKYIGNKGIICSNCNLKSSQDKLFYYCIDNDDKIILTCGGCTPEYVKEPLITKHKHEYMYQQNKKGDAIVRSCYICEVFEKNPQYVQKE